MSKPLTNKFNELLRQSPISLHVPGHKNMTIGQLEQLDFKMDMTEITGLDDLHQPEDVILKSMEGISKHPDYEAYYLVNGTTSGILSVIQGFSTQNGKYTMVRNAHKSVFHALELTCQNALLLEMDISLKTNQYLGPNLSKLPDEMQDTKLAIFTYPNYYGECFDISYTIMKLKEVGVPVLIDEAHGAHFGLEGFPSSSLNTGADYVVQSYHKSLPSLTMSSILFIHKNAPQRQNVIKYLTYFQSSSPSYLLMTSLELAHDFYKKYDSALFFEKRYELINTLKQIGLEVIEVDDPLKLNISGNGYTGFELQKLFEMEKIYIELADNNQILLVLPLWHEEDMYPFELLLERLKNINFEKRKPNNKTEIEYLTEKGVYYSGEIDKIRNININKSVNKILATHIVPYPPGIPLMFKGEKITENMVKLMNYWQDSNLRVEGIKNHKIEIKDE